MLKTSAITSDLRVDIDKVNNLMNAVGELVISYSVINQSLNVIKNSGKDRSKTDFLDKEFSNHGKIVKQIQSQVMSIRMVQIKTTFQKMARLVRDIARKREKGVMLTTKGEETELDKNVIEEITDPLIHIIRNAVDHGIESRDERIAKGKPEKGHILLTAFHKGGNMVVEIRDDGKGFDKDIILQKAIEKKIVKSDEKLTEREIFNLIFLPGFSTAETVTDISGRGVGMNIVQKCVKKLRGKIDISSKVDEGTSFIVKIPLTMAIIDGMLVKVGKEKYIIPTFSIVESIRPRKEDITTVNNSSEVINIRGSLFPVIRLHQLYSIENAKINPWNAMLILVESSNLRACILVDDLLSQQQVVIKTLDERFNNVKSIFGGAILGDGKVSLILDVDMLLEGAEKIRLSTN